WPGARPARAGVAQRVVDGDRAIGAVDTDVHVQAERVVAPDDVAEDLVVAVVVRRVDDPLVLPAAPRMCAAGREPDVDLRGDRPQLRTALAHQRVRLRERLAATRPHLDLRSDQLADEVLFDL